MASSTGVLPRRSVTLEGSKPPSSSTIRTVNSVRVRSLGASLKRQRSLVQALTAKQLFHLLHRLLIIMMALLYCATSVMSSIAMLDVLDGTPVTKTAAVEYKTELVQQYLGNSTIRESPLVMNVLGNSTTPRSGVVYLEENGTSTDGCHTSKFNSYNYGSTLIRGAFLMVKRDCYWKYPMLVQLGIIVPVVDCTFPPVQSGDLTLFKAFLLFRNVSNYEDIYIMAIEFSMQDYTIPSQNEVGPVGLLSFTTVNDMRATNLTRSFAGAQGYPFETAVFQVLTPLQATARGWLAFRTVPQDPTTVAAKTMYTARRTGFYVNSESDRSNVINTIWQSSTDAVSVVTSWTFDGVYVLRNKWAWAHSIHILFALDMLFNLSVLFLLVYRQFLVGRIWIGDAFASISTTLFGRGLLLLVSWGIEKFWTMAEFCLYTSNELASYRHVPVNLKIIHADLMTFYLCVLTVIANVLRDQIDPTLAIILFELVFYYHVPVTNVYSSAVTKLIGIADEDASASVVQVSKTVATSSHFRMWTIHKLSSDVQSKMILPIATILSSIGLLLAYALCRTACRRLKQRSTHHKQILSPHERNEDHHHSENPIEHYDPLSRTQFELATGTQLQARVGVVAHFDPCKYIKGMKYASADGLYTSGFVIANGKFLIAVVDLIPIMVTKILRYRFRNVYVFIVDGSTVQECALLVYPQTIAWSDLLHLNVSILS